MKMPHPWKTRVRHEQNGEGRVLHWLYASGMALVQWDSWPHDRYYVPIEDLEEA